MACFVDIHTHGCSSHDHDIVEEVRLDVADIAIHFDEDIPIRHLCLVLSMNI